MTTTDDNNTHAQPGPRPDLLLPSAVTAQRVPPGYPLPKPDYELRESDLAGEDVIQRDRRRARQRTYRGLARLLRLRPVSRRAMYSALVAEQAHIAGGRDPATPTHGEIVVGGRAKAVADRMLARCQRRLHRIGARVDRLRARQARLLTRARFTDASRVRHPDGGHRPVAAVRADADSQRIEIEHETSCGSRKHLRLLDWLASIPKVVLVVDFCLLTYFLAGVTDVDWASPVSMSVVFALLLSLLITVPCYGFLTFTGHRLRGCKDHTGTIRPANVDGVSAVAVAVALLLIGVVGTLMFARMRTEVGYALGSGSAQTALLIALAVAVVSASANVLVIGVHALDGSNQTARLHALSVAASRPMAKAERLRRRAALIPHRLAVLRRRARRLADRAITQASRRLAAADQVITAARGSHLANGTDAGTMLDPGAHAGAIGYRAPLTGPRPDARTIATALARIEDDR
ncbi:MAG: hypothetical protein ABSD40_13510 [Streptosporangiaceae bacterium]|jgi:hypothetical protein